MATYLPDTNVLIGFGRDPTVSEQFDRAIGRGDTFVVAPPVLIELVRGLIRAAASGVVPEHYLQLIEMISTSVDLDDFRRKSKADGSVWGDIIEAYEIHEAQLDKEFVSMPQLIEYHDRREIARLLSLTLGAQGYRQHP